VQWAWAGAAYHAAFFAAINPAAWSFAVSFVIESGLLVWFGLVRDDLRFTPTGSPAHIVGWTLIVYALVYPALVYVDGHVFPRAPTFGVPCPTTLLTIGWLFMADSPWPKLTALIPVSWAFIGGSAAMLLGVHADLMLWIAGIALAAAALAPASNRVRA
jgi:hypothetical protein